MTTTSLLSNGKARDLFNQLDERDYYKVVCVTVSHPNQIQFRLRYCYNRHGTTGGMVLTWWSKLNRDFSRKACGVIRIKADILDKMEASVSRAITKVIRHVANEGKRVAVVSKLAEMARPLESPKFSDWIKEWDEKDELESVYVNMSIVDAEKWIKRLETYKP